MLPKIMPKISSIYLPEKIYFALVAQYFVFIYIVKNRWLIPFFLIKTKPMKCYTVRYDFSFTKDHHYFEPFSFMSELIYNAP